MSTPEQLLREFQPFLKYDGQEAYFADAAETILVSPGDTLRQAGGHVIATAGAGLALALLGPDHYGDQAHTPVAATDVLSIPDRDYRARARKLHQDLGLANVVYGHVATDHDGATWLQYWYWYLFNDYNLLGPLIRAGLHEGDWEMVQVRLDAAGQPDLAVYAQHHHAQARPWDEVERVPETRRPVVYVARGSHAAYFSPGRKWTGVWWDWADGRRQSPDRQRLVVVDDADPAFAWVRWPGRWGDTLKGGGIAPADSPQSPGVRTHWDDPLKLLTLAAAKPAIPADAPGAIPPPPPSVAAARDATGAVLTYRVAPAPGVEAPDQLIITINSKDDRVPPAARNVPIAGLAGRVMLRGLRPGKRYDLHVSAGTPSGLASESVRVDLAALDPADQPPG